MNCKGKIIHDNKTLDCKNKWTCKHFKIKDGKPLKSKSDTCQYYEYSWPKLIGTKHEIS